jgi:5-methylcytosine-specific restriction endonuclease McrA
VRLEDLAVPFATHICEHLARVDRQGTFRHSKFLDACRYFNAGRISADELRTATTLLGFVNVIDAFHVVGDGDTPTRFFIDERSTTGGIRLTDDLLSMANEPGVADLIAEAESRWRLVEEAWDARADGQQVIVLYDAPRELLVPALTGRRRSITEVRPALNGYQKGHCFYCFRPISNRRRIGELPDVDHVLPHSLMARGFPVDLDGPWNLVLACQTCNRGPAGKFATLPHSKYKRAAAQAERVPDQLEPSTQGDPHAHHRTHADVATAVPDNGLRDGATPHRLPVRVGRC